MSDEQACPDEIDSACWYHGCGRPDAPHLILWKCPAGHRMPVRYCDEHAGMMMRLALQFAEDPDDGPGCAKCPGPEAVMRPAVEGVLQR